MFLSNLHEPGIAVLDIFDYALYHLMEDCVILVKNGRRYNEPHIQVKIFAMS